MRLPLVTAVVVVTPTVVPIPIVVPVPTRHSRGGLYSKPRNNTAWQGFTFKGLRSWTAEAQELYCMSAGLGEKSPRSKSYSGAVSYWEALGSTASIAIGEGANSSQLSVRDRRQSIKTIKYEKKLFTAIYWRQANEN